MINGKSDRLQYKTFSGFKLLNCIILRVTEFWLVIGLAIYFSYSRKHSHLTTGER